MYLLLFLHTCWLQGNKVLIWYVSWHWFQNKKSKLVGSKHWPIIWNNNLRIPVGCKTVLIVDLELALFIGMTSRHFGKESPFIKNISSLEWACTTYMKSDPRDNYFFPIVNGDFLKHCLINLSRFTVKNKFLNVPTHAWPKPITTSRSFRTRYTWMNFI